MRDDFAIRVQALKRSNRAKFWFDTSGDRMQFCGADGSPIEHYGDRLVLISQSVDDENGAGPDAPF